MEAAKDSTASATPATLFEPFSWVHLNNSNPLRGLAELAALARDVAWGVDTVIALAEMDEVNSACGDEAGRPLPQLLSKFHHGSLQRLARVSLSMLGEAADKALEQMHETQEAGCRGCVKPS